MLDWNTRYAGAVTMTVLLVVSAGIAAVPVSAAQQGSGSAEAGTFVSFETTDNAVVDYSVNGETVVENLSTRAEGGTDGGIDLGGDAGISVAGLDLSTSLTAGGTAELTAKSGATIAVHDNQRGEFVVRPNDGGQAVRLGLSTDTAAEQQSDKRVVLTTGDGNKAVVLATGDGTVSVTDTDNVTAHTGSNGEIVYRQYEGRRSESEKRQEEMITNGTATASVYVQQAESSGESAGEDGAKRAVNVVQYGQDTTVDVTQQSATTVNATVDRSTSEGRAVIVTVSDKAFENAQNAKVYVDGEAAAQVDSYGEIRSATDGGDRPAYMIEQSGSAEATTDVVVGINHFSAREVSVQSGDDSSSGGFGPGFGIGAALAALAALGLFAVRRR